MRQLITNLTSLRVLVRILLTTVLFCSYLGNTANCIYFNGELELDLSPLQNTFITADIKEGQESEGCNTHVEYSVCSAYTQCGINKAMITRECNNNRDQCFISASPIETSVSPIITEEQSSFSYIGEYCDNGIYDKSVVFWICDESVSNYRLDRIEVRGNAQVCGASVEIEISSQYACPNRYFGFSSLSPTSSPTSPGDFEESDPSGDSDNNDSFFSNMFEKRWLPITVSVLVSVSLILVLICCGFKYGFCKCSSKSNRNGNKKKKTNHNTLISMFQMGKSVSIDSQSSTDVRFIDDDSDDEGDDFHLMADDDPLIYTPSMLPLNSPGYGRRGVPRNTASTLVGESELGSVDFLRSPVSMTDAPSQITDRSAEFIDINHPDFNRYSLRSTDRRTDVSSTRIMVSKVRKDTNYSEGRSSLTSEKDATFSPLCGLCELRIDPSQEWHRGKCGHYFHRECILAQQGSGFDLLRTEDTISCIKCHKNEQTRSIKSSFKV